MPLSGLAQALDGRPQELLTGEHLLVEIAVAVDAFQDGRDCQLARVEAIVDLVPCKWCGDRGCAVRPE
jgi:hypothetical protein